MKLPCVCVSDESVSLNNPSTLATAIKIPLVLQTAEVSCEPIKILYKTPERPLQTGELKLGDWPFKYVTPPV